MKIVSWVIGIGALIALAGLIFALTTSAHAQEGPPPQYIKDLTVGHFRAWDTTSQAAYVLGVMSFSEYSGLHCPTRRAVGEYQAALVHNRVDLRDTDPLPKAILALFLRNGCEVK